MEVRAVFRDANTHCVIRVDVTTRHTFFVENTGTEYAISKMKTEEFNHRFDLLENYDPKRAAQKFLSNAYIPSTSAARTQLTAILENTMSEPKTFRAPSASPKAEAKPKAAPAASPKPEPKAAPAASPKPKAAPKAAAKPVAPKAVAKTAPKPEPKKASKPEPKKAAPKAEPKAEATVRAGGLAERYPATSTIKILVTENPRRGQKAETYAAMKDGMTIAQFLKKTEATNGNLYFIDHAVKNKFIKVVAAK